MIKRIYLENFRNYPEKEVEFTSGINLILGDNGAGKTNMLEAVYLLLEGKSPRTGDVREVVRKGEERAIIKGWAWEETGERGEVVVEREGGVSRRDLRGIKAVSFTPDDIYMVKGGPEERRRYLDEIIGRVKKGYRELSKEYARILRQRNEAIRMVRKELWGRERIRHWNALLVRKGEEITRERMEMVERAARSMKCYASKWHMGEVAIKYYSNLFAAVGKSEGKRSEFADNEERLRRMEEADIRRGTTLLGPHRDELVLKYNGMSARRMCSQGEQKILSLLMRLAQADIVEEYSGRKPLLLLDDCFSEMDASNRGALLAVLENWGQVLVTSTDDIRAESVKARILL